MCFIARTQKIHSHQRYIHQQGRQSICDGGGGGYPKETRQGALASGRNNATHRSDLKVWSMVRIEGSPNLTTLPCERDQN